MVIVQLKGGLGNQMFQFASAFAIAKNNHAHLKLDLRFLKDKTHKENFTLRDFELSIFSDNFSEIGIFEVRSVLFISSVLRKFKLNLRGFHWSVFFEKYFNYDEMILSLKGNFYLIGYFQSEKYFHKYRSELLKVFKFRLPLSGESLNLSKDIKKENAVSIHIRRGDYVNNAQVNSVHGVCSIEYYLEAVKLITERVSDPFFYVFSDDIDWVKENLFLEHKTVFVSHNTGTNSYQDMELMSYCKHNIIANSSFSWWGAWLNENPGKTVIAPQKWFFDPDTNALTADLIPAEWIRI